MSIVLSTCHSYLLLSFIGIYQITLDLLKHIYIIIINIAGTSVIAVSCIVSAVFLRSNSIYRLNAKIEIVKGFLASRCVTPKSIRTYEYILVRVSEFALPTTLQCNHFDSILGQNFFLLRYIVRGSNNDVPYKRKNTDYDKNIIISFC